VLWARAQAENAGANDPSPAILPCSVTKSARLQAPQSVQLADEGDHPPSQEAVMARLMVEEGKEQRGAHND
jgi:hypothetical protein